MISVISKFLSKSKVIESVMINLIKLKFLNECFLLPLEYYPDETLAMFFPASLFMVFRCHYRMFAGFLLLNFIVLEFLSATSCSFRQHKMVLAQKINQ